MSTFAVSERPRVQLRPLALPSEHGGWGFLLEPIALGLVVAPSLGGMFIAAGAVAAFLARHPLKLAAQDFLRRRRYPRTRACELLALGYLSLAFAFFAAAPFRALIAMAFAVPFALSQFVYDARNRGRALTPEIFGVIAPGAIAAAIVIAAGRPVVFAATLWLLIALRALPSILYVRSALRGFPRAAMIGAHVLAIAIAAFTTPFAVVAMVLLLGRALPSASGVAARTMGLREIGWGTLTVGLLALGYTI